MDDISAFFERREPLVGELRLPDGTVIDTCAAQVHYNTLLPRKMSAHFTQMSSPATFFKIVRAGTFTFIMANPNFRKRVKAQPPSIVMGSSHTEMTAKVDEYESTWFYHDPSNGDPGPLTTTHSYAFALPAVLTRGTGGVFDQHRGFYYGMPDNPIFGAPQNVVTWNDEIIEVIHNDLTAKIFQALEQFDVTEDNIGFPAFGHARYGKAVVTSSMPTTTLDDRDREARELVETILRVISVIERNRFEWHREKRLTETVDSLFEERELHHFSAPHRDDSSRRLQIEANRPVFRNLIPEITAKVLALGTNDRKNFDDIARCMILASIASTIEGSYIYWHSCLDLILKTVGYPAPAFSPKFIAACEALNVQYDDLFPTPTKAEVNAKQKFRFSEIRNEYIHEGLVMSDFYEAFEQRTRMAAVSERMLLALIGIDYTTTPLGKVPALI